MPHRGRAKGHRSSERGGRTGLGISLFSVNMAEAEVEAFLSNLATQRGVSASTPNQALCSLLFRYKLVLGVELGRVAEVTRAKRPERVPVVLTREEATLVLAQLRGREWLMASLLDGTGLRLMGSERFRAADLVAGFGGRRSGEEAASRILGAAGVGESCRMKSAVRGRK